ncbi:MAG: hypothetical protein U0M47_08705, partial [Merdibacter sp.]|nr:hypothetical protein [Merdibacter sp.]
LPHCLSWFPPLYRWWCRSARPLLFGDFSKVSIKDCGRDELQQESCNGKDDVLVCTMTGYMNCKLEDKQAIWGLKII